ncbi:hypothetical protein GCM10008908_38900 [Clostridium subterminale]|uniref:Uncharacterized protein n=1 Tax=Clostridium subterminale TaxID=1550 RepID=A0ABP3WA86_CLOSU
MDKIFIGINLIIDTIAEQEAFGVAIAKGILKHLGMTTEVSKPTPESVPTPSKKKIDSFIKLDNFSWVQNYKSSNGNYDFAGNDIEIDRV